MFCFGVPRSPNHHLNQLCVIGQFDVHRRQIQLNGLANVRAGFLLRVASRRAPGQFWADRRVASHLRVVLQNNSEGHTPIIWLNPSLSPINRL